MACPDKSQVISTSAVPVYPYYGSLPLGAFNLSHSFNAREVGLIHHLRAEQMHFRCSGPGSSPRLAPCGSLAKTTPLFRGGFCLSFVTSGAKPRRVEISQQLTMTMMTASIQGHMYGTSDCLDSRYSNYGRFYGYHDVFFSIAVFFPVSLLFFLFSFLFSLPCIRIQNSEFGNLG